jgi:hypothetical protein
MSHVVISGDALLESADVARIADVTAETVRAAVRAGKLIPTARTSRGSLFDRKAVESWCASRSARRTVSVNFGFRVKRGSEVAE